MATTSHDSRCIAVMLQSCGVTADAWHGGHHMAVVWRVGGRVLAMSHGSGHTEIVVGVRWQSRRVVVAAWHGGGGWLHGLVVVMAVVSRRLWHGGGGCGCSDSGHVVPRWPCGMAGGHMTWWWWWWRQQQLCHAMVQL